MPHIAHADNFAYTLNIRDAGRMKVGKRPSKKLQDKDFPSRRCARACCTA